MAQNQKNQKGKNFILISQASGRGLDPQVPNFYSRNSSLASQLYNFEPNTFGRQSSITGNLFKSFETTEKHKQEPLKTIQEPKINDAQRYAQQCLEYEKYQFDDRIKLIIHRMAIQAYRNFKDKFENKFLSFSIQKLLSIISKKLLLNRFQLLFLQYVFEETKWNFDIACIAEHSEEYISYATSSENQNQTKALKQLEIYFLYCSFYSKKSLNELPCDGKASKGHKFNGLTGYLKSLCKKFNVYFQEWTQKSNVSNIKINPKNLNSIFKRLTYYTDREQQDVENYCLLVEEILDISPAYNAEKGGTKSKKTKKIKKEEEKIQHQREDEEMIINQEQQAQDSLEEIHPLRNKRQTSYLSNVDGFEPQKYINNNNNNRMI